MAASQGHSGAQHAPWICGNKRKSRSQPAIVKREYALRLAMKALDNRETRIMAILRDSTIPLGVSSLSEETGWTDQAHVVGAAMGLTERGLASLSEEESVLVKLGVEGHKAARDGLLEMRMLEWLQSRDPQNRSMAAISEDFDKTEAGAGVGILRSMGVRIVGGRLEAPDMQGALSEAERRTAFIMALSDSPIPANELDERLTSHFAKRRGLIELERSVSRSWSATEKGLSLGAEELIEIDQINEITPDLLQGDAWRTKEFKPFDIHAPAPIPLGGRPHPLQSLIDRIRAVFLEMGFSEISGNFVQSAGWNMDALFIPQDHPARTMQDTFYLEDPAKMEIESSRLEQWEGTHERGMGTTSSGWGGNFDKDESRRGLLRTHTTVNTVRHIAENPSSPSRVFGVGRVFRQETIDRTHLPEFHQIEGIIHEESASLPMLITTLRTFYSKMGYSDVRVRPAYFPYTEPSIEVEILWRGKWLELGGAGIFRPEVTQPLGTDWPVCAWGMGLERLAMLILGLEDIRELYQPDLMVLSKMPIL